MKIFLIFLLFLTSVSTFAQKATHDFALRGADTLRLDLYKPSANPNGATVVYVFGGGFVVGSRIEQDNVQFYDQLLARGYAVAAIDYRLGLKGVTKVGPLHSRPVFDAVKLASEDLISATEFLISNAGRLSIDTSKIVYIGSSAGAITVLQTSYEISRRSAMVAALPASFRPAAVVSLAGAVFSTNGRLKYGTPPPPTAFFHGTADKVVIYKKIRLFNIGMFGTDALVDIFNKSGYPYVAVRYKDAKHEVAGFPRSYAAGGICDFIDSAVFGDYDNQIDIMVKDRYVAEKFADNLTLKQLYNGN